MISGSLKTFPLGDVFQLVAMSQKSGILTVERGGARARVYFSVGRVAYAHLNTGAHLGEVLVRLDLLSALEVQQILMTQRQESPGTLLGRVAVERGILTEEDLAIAIEAQAYDVVTELLSWSDGAFEFGDADTTASQVPLGSGIDAAMLLMRVVHGLEEFKQHAAPPEAIFKRAGDPTHLELPTGGWEVLGQVDGRRSARTITAELDLPESRVLAILGELEELGVVERSPYQADEPIVLVVSSSTALNRLIKLALQRSGLRSAHIDSVADVFGGINEHHPRALVVDDDSNEAWEFVRELRRSASQGHLPVLVLVDKAPRGTLFRPLPRAEWLMKPFQELELQQQVTSLVGKSKIA